MEIETDNSRADEEELEQRCKGVRRRERLKGLKCRRCVGEKVNGRKDKSAWEVKRVVEGD